jgi:hypothetical protein
VGAGAHRLSTLNCGLRSQPVQTESDGEPDDLSLWDVDWENPAQVRALMAEIDAKVEAEEDPNHPHMQWLKEDRQRRIDGWGCAFFGIGVIPPERWESWVL